MMGGEEDRVPKSPHLHNLTTPYCLEGPVLRCFSLAVPNL